MNLSAARREDNPRLLQENPEPIKIVPDAQRAVWTSNTYRWRCEHVDGRGQCTSRDTRAVWIREKRCSAAFCEKHMPGGAS